VVVVVVVVVVDAVVVGSFVDSMIVVITGVMVLVTKRSFDVVGGVVAGCVEIAVYCAVLL